VLQIASNCTASSGNSQHAVTPRIGNFVQTYRRPTALDAGNGRRPIGNRGDLLTLSHEHVSPTQLERIASDSTTSNEIFQNLFVPTVDPCYGNYGLGRSTECLASRTRRSSSELPPA